MSPYRCNAHTPIFCVSSCRGLWHAIRWTSASPAATYWSWISVVPLPLCRHLHLAMWDLWSAGFHVASVSSGDEMCVACAWRRKPQLGSRAEQSLLRIRGFGQSLHRPSNSTEHLERVGA